MSVQLRLATVNDVASLAELGRTTFIETFGHQYTAQDLNAFLEKVFAIDSVRSDMEIPGMTICVAVDDSSQFIGYCKIGPIKVPVVPQHLPAWELRQLYMRKSHQSRGVGSQLIQWALNEFEQRQAASIYISVWSENTGARKLYERFGFEVVGSYQFMVGDHADDELIMARFPINHN